MGATHINVNLEGISTAISELQAIKASCDSSDIASIEMDGGGVTVTALQELLSIYTELSDGFSMLVSNTIGLMEKTRQEMENADANAAKLMQ